MNTLKNPYVQGYKIDKNGKTTYVRYKHELKPALNVARYANVNFILNDLCGEFNGFKVTPVKVPLSTFDQLPIPVKAPTTDKSLVMLGLLYQYLPKGTVCKPKLNNKTAMFIYPNKNYIGIWQDDKNNRYVIWETKGLKSHRTAIIAY